MSTSSGSSCVLLNLENNAVKLFLEAGFQTTYISSTLLCVKALGEFLSYVFYNGCDEASAASVKIGWVIEVIQHILVSCNDVDHQIRIGATCCLSKFYLLAFRFNITQLQNSKLPEVLR